MPAGLLAPADAPSRLVARVREPSGSGGGPESEPNPICGSGAWRVNDADRMRAASGSAAVKPDVASGAAVAVERAGNRGAARLALTEGESVQGQSMEVHPHSTAPLVHEP